VAKSIDWGFNCGGVQDVEVAVLPCGRGRCHITGNLSVSSHSCLLHGMNLYTDRVQWKRVRVREASILPSVVAFIQLCATIRSIECRRTDVKVSVFLYALPVQEGATLAIKTAVEALHGQFKGLMTCYGTGSMAFALPLTRQDLHIHLPGHRYKVCCASPSI
jgi:hypothetical protein